MKKKKWIKLIIIPLCILVVAGILAGIFYFRKEKRRIDVQQVSELNWFGGESGVTGSGTIISDGSQSVYLSKENPIEKVYVKQGQQVSIGDPLLAYDMTKAKIQLEIKKLEMEKVQYDLAIVQKEWKQLSEMKPIEPEKPEPEQDSEQEPAQESDQKEGYTKEELAKKLFEKKKQMQELDLKLRMTKLEIETLKEASTDGIIKSQINGTVKAIQSEDNKSNDNDPYIFLTQSEGLYLYGTISELQLESIKAGQVVSGNSWESGEVFSATVKEIESFPTASGEDMGNQAVSYYGFKAYIEDTSKLKVGEGVEYNIAMDEQKNMEVITLPKAYVREADGQYYVLKEGKDHRVQKQFVKVGKVVYGTAYEIVDGITAEDYIAFPYGNNAVINTRAKRVK